jgi:DNA replication protein DnaC
MGAKMVYPGVYEFVGEFEGDESETYKVKAMASYMPLETRVTKRISTFEEIPGREKALEAAFAFIRGEIQPPMLLLYGEPGRSKTHLAMAIGWCYVAQLKSVRFYHVGDFLDQLRGSWRLREKFSHDSYEAIMNYCKNCALLILDDLGVEDLTSWASGRVDTIVDYRYERGKATIVTANTLEISDRILDRMKEGQIVLCEGESYREIISKRKKGEK